MALESSNSFVECIIVSVPNEYINSIFDNAQVNESLYGLKTNSVIINEATSLKLGLSRRSESHRTLIHVEFQFNLDRTELNHAKRRHVHVIVDESVKDGAVVLSEELLFNLQSTSNQSLTINSVISAFVTVCNEERDDFIIPKASKVVVSLFRTQSSVEPYVVDELLQRHFMFPNYLCNGDVFGEMIDKDHICRLNSKVSTDIIYFKVVELESSDNQCLTSSKGFFVDNSVTLYQASSCQGFVPRRKISLHYKPNWHTFTSNEIIWSYLLTHNHFLVPSSFDNFNTICKSIKPFFSTPQRVQDLGLSPVFLLTGPNGSGKSMLLQAASQFFGVNYWRVDCVSIGGAIPGQGETKLKTIFNQLKTIAPCLLQLSNIEVLCQDADNKEDVRVMSCFEEQLKMLHSKWPIIVVATSHNANGISSSLNHLFLDSITITAPNCDQRKSIISWLFYCSNESLSADILETVAAQTSGFVFRDLQVLVSLAFKERFKRSKEGNVENIDFITADFTKIIGTMHKAFSESIGAPKVSSVLWKDVGGLEHLKKEILRSLRSNMFNSGLKRSGLLLHGPPGTGKTLLAKAVATQCGRNFLSVKGPELLNMYVGQSEHNVRELFELAKAASPCIIFFDELDSLAPNRGSSGDSGGVMDRVVSQLLAEMDDLTASSDVFILGATNRPDLIDPALLRPGRLDKLLYVGPCEDRSSQLSVLSALTHKLSLDPEVDLQDIVSLLPHSVTGAQLSALCSAAWLSSARQIINSGEDKPKSIVTVNRHHFTSALREVFQ